jgi:hypothetical protein
VSAQKLITEHTEFTNIPDTHLHNNNSIAGIIAPNTILTAFLITGLFSKISISCELRFLYNSTMSRPDELFANSSSRNFLTVFTRGSSFPKR